MKTIELYKCDICGTQYKEKTQCAKCEESHVKTKRIVGKQYQPITINEKGYPYRIVVEFSNGKQAVYEYTGEKTK